ncbi:hypothetical protein NPIL_216301 [Nephila pilipes]|uniref:Uncharacterized protein n=1 Tax=Nephila pilipes TaxID=299642 RepID=A0A8X6NEE0_NEPPI|nr:hypothetical protein NPIL_216301 [Nephila pilipes]
MSAFRFPITAVLFHVERRKMSVLQLKKRSNGSQRRTILKKEDIMTEWLQPTKLQSGSADLRGEYVTENPVKSKRSYVLGSSTTNRDNLKGQLESGPCSGAIGDIHFNLKQSSSLQQRISHLLVNEKHSKDFSCIVSPEATKVRSSQTKRLTRR